MGVRTTTRENTSSQEWRECMKMQEYAHTCACVMSPRHAAQAQQRERDCSHVVSDPHIVTRGAGEEVQQLNLSQVFLRKRGCPKQVGNQLDGHHVSCCQIPGFAVGRCVVVVVIWVCGSATHTHTTAPKNANTAAHNYTVP